jgi:uncharacterized membrane protein
MMYYGFSWLCILFGLFLLVSAREIVRFQVDAAEIIATLSIGGIGFIMLVMGIFGLWECWRKRVN